MDILTKFVLISSHAAHVMTNITVNFTDEKMLKTFPNIKFEDKDGNIIWVKDILTDIQPYYFKISDRFRLK